MRDEYTRSVIKPITERMILFNKKVLDKDDLGKFALFDIHVLTALADEADHLKPIAEAIEAGTLAPYAEQIQYFEFRRGVVRTEPVKYYVSDDAKDKVLHEVFFCDLPVATFGRYYDARACAILIAECTTHPKACKAAESAEGRMHVHTYAF